MTNNTNSITNLQHSINQRISEFWDRYYNTQKKVEEQAKIVQDSSQHRNQGATEGNRAVSHKIEMNQDNKSK